MEPASAAAADGLETEEAPVTEVRASLLSTVRDRCIECGVPLAADQRYCLECGTRNGEPRMPLLAGARPPRATPAAPKARRVHLGPNATLIAGIGTLLLAMGVGVLIGRTGDNGSAKATPQVITVPAASGTASTTGAAAATAAGTATAATTAKHEKSAKAGKARSSGTTNPIPNAKVKIPKAVVKIGETKGSGPGYDKKTHKFTGNFFGQ